MISKSQTIRQMIIISLAVLLLPMIVFPSRLGTQLMSFSFPFLLAELIFYGAIIFWSKRDTTLIRLVTGAGICLFYRLFLGLLFGSLVSVMYVMNLKISLSLGMVSYLPAILCQVIATPFILKPVLNDIVFSDKRRPRLVIDSAPVENPKHDQVGINKESSNVQQEIETMTPWVDTAKNRKGGIGQQVDTLPGKNINGFDRATQYIGENGSVMMAVVVDNEGLLLSNFARDNISLDEWAPLALLFKQNNNRVLDRVGMRNVDKVTLTVENMRITVASEDRFNLMVLADIQQDDVLNIRITQGMEIIRKYIEERYGQELFENAENKYV